MEIFDQGVVAKKGRKPRLDKKTAVFLMGCLCGTAFFYLIGGDDIILENDFWEHAFLENGQSGLLQYVFSLRLKQVMVLCLCACSYLGKFLAFGFFCTLGFKISVIFLTFAYNFGMRGILLTMAMTLPQGVFYFLLTAVILEGCYDTAKPSIYKEKRILIWKIIMGVILFLLGYLSEICINFDVLNWIIDTQ